MEKFPEQNNKDIQFTPDFSKLEKSEVPKNEISPESKITEKFAKEAFVRLSKDERKRIVKETGLKGIKKAVFLKHPKMYVKLAPSGSKLLAQVINVLTTDLQDMRKSVHKQMTEKLAGYTKLSEEEKKELDQVLPKVEIAPKEPDKNYKISFGTEEYYFDSFIEIKNVLDGFQGDIKIGIQELKQAVFLKEQEDGSVVLSDKEKQLVSGLFTNQSVHNYREEMQEARLLCCLSRFERAYKNEINQFDKDTRNNLIDKDKIKIFLKNNKISDFRNIEDKLLEYFYKRLQDLHTDKSKQDIEIAQEIVNLSNRKTGNKEEESRLSKLKSQSKEMDTLLESLETFSSNISSFKKLSAQEKQSFTWIVEADQRLEEKFPRAVQNQEHLLDRTEQMQRAQDYSKNKKNLTAKTIWLYEMQEFFHAEPLIMIRKQMTGNLDGYENLSDEEKKQVD